MAAEARPLFDPDPGLPRVTASFRAEVGTFSKAKGGATKVQLVLEDGQAAELFAALCLAQEDGEQYVVLVSCNPERSLLPAEALGALPAERVAIGLRLTDALAHEMLRQRDGRTGRIEASAARAEPPVLPVGTVVGETMADARVAVARAVEREGVPAVAQAAGRSVRRGRTRPESEE